MQCIRECAGVGKGFDADKKMVRANAREFLLKEAMRVNYCRGYMLLWVTGFSAFMMLRILPSSPIPRSV
jgi:hypothetical protein